MIPPRAPASLSLTGRVFARVETRAFSIGPSADKREPAHGCDRPCWGCRWIATHPPQSRMCTSVPVPAQGVTVSPNEIRASIFRSRTCAY